jgi:hypothetical protein
MKKKTCTLKIVLLSLLFCFLLIVIAQRPCRAADTSPPASPVKLIFIHHSCGENWLTDSNGGLGISLMNNNYYVSDTNYGWGSTGMGELTDIGYWWDWFRGPSSSSIYLNEIYSENNKMGNYYTRMSTNPGGENTIIMFKSCFPNSYLSGDPNAPANTGSNPLRGEDCWSDYMTVANAKGIYNDLLEYFATRQDKLFIAVTAPPQVAGDTDAAHAANARAFNNWLVNDWLAHYPYHNVAVFDFYNVLTSNGGNSQTNDIGSQNGNHHRWRNGAVEHPQTISSNIAAYPSDSDDSHPTQAGNLKATTEFLPLLNWFYHRWQESGSTTIQNGYPATPQTPIVFPTTVDPTATPVSVTEGMVSLQPQLRIQDCNEVKTAVAYAYMPSANFGALIPATVTCTTGIATIKIASGTIDFTGFPNVFYIYYGYTDGNGNIHYNAYMLTVQSR